MTEAVWITPAYPWDDEPVGGVFYQTQARALARQGIGVTVACPTPWSPWPLSRIRARWRNYASAPRFALDEGVDVVRPLYIGIPSEPRWALPDRLSAGAAWRARAAWTGACLIHGHSAVTGLAAWRLSRRTGLPFVLTFHGSDLNTWPDAHPDRVPDLLAAARDAGAIVAVSAALAARAEALTSVAAIHLPLGSDHRSLAALAMPRDEARAALGLVDERIVVLFVGGLLATKGVRELADAIAVNPSRFLGVFVGNGPELGYGIDGSRTEDCLKYRGARPHDEIPVFMSAADVLVLPSHREGLPTVLVEAGSIGLPVIASAVGGIPQLLGDDRGTILPNTSAAAIAQALTDFEGHRSAFAAASARLLAFVLTEHDVDKNAARLLGLYGSLR